MIAQRSLVMACLASAASLMLSACASDPRYPSLAIRDVERVEGNSAPAEPDDEPVIPAPLPSGLGERLAQLQQQAEASHQQFLRRADAARSRSAAAAGAAQGSTRWSDAIVAISDVESARSDTMFALAELDSMLVLGAAERADSGAATGLPQIAATRDSVAALVAEEDEVLAALTDPIGG